MRLDPAAIPVGLNVQSVLERRADLRLGLRKLHHRCARRLRPRPVASGQGLCALVAIRRCPSSCAIARPSSESRLSPVCAAMESTRSIKIVASTPEAACDVDRGSRRAAAVRRLPCRQFARDLTIRRANSPVGERRFSPRDGCVEATRRPTKPARCRFARSLRLKRPTRSTLRWPMRRAAPGGGARAVVHAHGDLLPERFGPVHRHRQERENGK